MAENAAWRAGVCPLKFQKNSRKIPVRIFLEKWGLEKMLLNLGIFFVTATESDGYENAVQIPVQNTPLKGWIWTGKSRCYEIFYQFIDVLWITEKLFLTLLRF
jgi:hypothetical protein